jgi:hypothetical protein
MTKASKKLFDMAGIGYRQIKQYNLRINNEKTD